MQRSDDRILTTHTGSLPRTPALVEMLVRVSRCEAVDAVALACEVEALVVAQVDRRPLPAGQPSQRRICRPQLLAADRLFGKTRRIVGSFNPFSQFSRRCASAPPSIAVMRPAVS